MEEEGEAVGGEVGNIGLRHIRKRTAKDGCHVEYLNALRFIILTGL